MACVSGSSAKMSSPNVSAPAMAVTPAAADQKSSPALFEIYGKIWNVQARLGQGVSASVYRVSSGRATSAVKEFQVDAQGGDYGYLKESSVLEKIQGHKNIGKHLDKLRHIGLKQEGGDHSTNFRRSSISFNVVCFYHNRVIFKKKSLLHGDLEYFLGQKGSFLSK